MALPATPSWVPELEGKVNNLKLQSKVSNSCEKGKNLAKNPQVLFIKPDFNSWEICLSIKWEWQLSNFFKKTQIMKIFCCIL